ncbi:MAG TPA: hypothetical protein VH163_02830 [Gemmatimonadales bacterium]|nr:hypothetical protein [Gemmatimonadales bacterium]
MGRTWCLLLMFAAACRTPASRTAAVPDTTDTATAAAADGEMANMAGRSADLHMAMTPAWPLTAGDSARAQAIVDRVRSSLGKYRDVRVALADGFKEFLPNVKHQKVDHFTNWRHAVTARFSFDPASPTSLLYKEDSGGAGMTLVGVMYTESPGASLNELNRRVPLSIAHWHEHVNWCLPPRDRPARWQDSTGGKPVFGPLGPIATQAACDSVGGRFFPRIFGWMVHVNAFASNDPKIIWGGEDHDDHMKM